MKVAEIENAAEADMVKDRRSAMSSNKGFATRANAVKKLENVLDGSDMAPVWAVMALPTGRFMPVVFLDPQNGEMRFMHSFASQGIGVMSH